MYMCAAIIKIIIDLTLHQYETIVGRKGYKTNNIDLDD